MFLIISLRTHKPQSPSHFWLIIFSYRLCAWGRSMIVQLETRWKPAGNLLQWVCHKKYKTCWVQGQFMAGNAMICVSNSFIIDGPHCMGYRLFLMMYIDSSFLQLNVNSRLLTFFNHELFNLQMGVQPTWNRKFEPLQLVRLSFQNDSVTIWKKIYKSNDNQYRSPKVTCNPKLYICNP